MANLSDKVAPSGVLTSTGDGSGLTGIAAVPTGAVFHFAAITAPSGYLEADGAAVSRSTYSALFSITGTAFGVGDGSSTFNLPDLRGEFIRGWDNGRGIDASRAFGSFQDQQTRWYKARANGSNADNFYNGGPYTGDFAGKDVDTATTARDRTIYDWDTSYDTLPRNVAMMYCIKF